MDPITQQQALAAAGAAGGEALYVDDVFSTFLYEGNGSSQTITNGIDLSGEGGLVWLKNRDNAERHSLQDTERGVNKLLDSSDTIAEVSITSVNSFNSDGFGLNTSNSIFNGSGEDYVSWTFRKAPGFFDVVTWSGNSTAGRQIPHSLGSTPGMIIVKRLTSAENWYVYHRSLGATKWIKFSTDQPVSTSSMTWNDTEPTSTHFTVGSDSSVNITGSDYVAYLFAHDDQSFGTNEDEAIIKCGSYTGNGSATGVLQNLGFEPQWVLIRRTDSTESWQLVDSMRGVTTGGDDKNLEPNSSTQEQNSDIIQFESLGFRPMSADGKTNGSGGSYIYIAIRRPHKPPSAATDVFAIDNKSAASTNTPQYTSNFPVDFLLNRFNVHATGGPSFRNRHANEYIQTNEATARVADSSNMTKFNYNNGYGDLTSSDSNDYVYMFRRAPGFADLVFYDGDGNTSRSINHNLGVAPELVIIKNRFNTSSGSSYWTVHSTQITASQYLRLDENQAVGAAGVDSYPTATTFPVSKSSSVYNTLNKSGDSYVAYLFASVAGICKIGKYTGAGGSTDVDVDCGFTNGARFVMIKKTNGVGDWNVFDTSRGINSGTEKYFTLNNSFAPYEFDVIDPLSSGFTVVNETAASQGFNVSGDTYLFIAIA